MSLSVGTAERFSDIKPVVSDIVTWNEEVEVVVTLAKDYADLPDVILHLWRGNEKSRIPVAFLRLSAVSLLSTGLSGAEPSWKYLSFDCSRVQSSKGYPGTLLTKIGMVPTSDREAHATDWSGEKKKLSQRRAINLRVYAYQARGLPSLGSLLFPHHHYIDSFILF